MGLANFKKRNRITLAENHQNPQLNIYRTWLTGVAAQLVCTFKIGKEIEVEPAEPVLIWMAVVPSKAVIAGR